MTRFKIILKSVLFLLACNIAYGQKLYHVNMEATSKWMQDFNGVTKIQVYWENPGIGNYTERQWVKDAIQETWSKYANVEFTNWEQYNYRGTGIRIFIDDYSHPHTKGLGKELDGLYQGMILNFNFLGDFKCGNHTREYCVKAIAVHEFGHALGIAHEQDRSDCGCEQHPRSYYGAGYYVTPCDLNSVMNYCNPTWNNGGKLSKYDIEGVQAIYGTRKSILDYDFDRQAGLSSATDELGNNQVWENLYFTIGNQQFIYNINETNREEIKTFKFSIAGRYQYTISSVSFHKDNRIYKGYGTGYLDIDNTKNYKIGIFAKDHQYPNFELYVTAKDIATEDEPYLKKDAGQRRQDPLPGYGNTFLRNGQKPLSLLLLDQVSHEKFYIYSDGTIMVYNKNNNTFFECGKKQSPYYKNWNGKIWAWSFYRSIGNNLQETYTISTTGEVWALSTDNIFKQFGIVTYVDF